MSQMTEDQLQELAQDLNSIRDEIVADLGERDANYIRRVIRLHRALEVGGGGLGEGGGDVGDVDEVRLA